MPWFYRWACGWKGCSVFGLELSQAEADASRAEHMTDCDYRFG